MKSQWGGGKNGKDSWGVGGWSVKNEDSWGGGGGGEEW